MEWIKQRNTPPLAHAVHLDIILIQLTPRFNNGTFSNQDFHFNLINCAAILPTIFLLSNIWVDIDAAKKGFETDKSKQTLSEQSSHQRRIWKDNLWNHQKNPDFANDYRKGVIRSKIV